MPRKHFESLIKHDSLMIMQKINGSIVTYNPDWLPLKEAIESFLLINPTCEIQIWDNSPDTALKERLKASFSERVFYRHSLKNIGFGAGHNHNFKVSEGSYFCILNPDIKMEPQALKDLIDFGESNPSVGLLSCTILNQDHSHQLVHKFLPSFYHYISLIARRLLKLKTLEDHHTMYDFNKTTSRLPLLSGCFMLFKSEHYKELKGFDERFFLYFEDYDISLRSFLMGKSIILNQVSVVHIWQRGSHKKFKLFMTHLISGLKFYAKWGFTSSFANKINAKV